MCDDEPALNDQYCFDTVLHQPVGAITQPLIHWINRPTFQQVVEVQGSRPTPAGAASDDPAVQADDTSEADPGNSPEAESGEPPQAASGDPSN